MVTLRQFTDGARGYMQHSVLPHLPANKQFVSGVALGVIANKADIMMQQIKDNQLIKMLGLIDGDMIDDDALIVALREQMERQGTLQLEIPWIGQLTFTAPDVDALQRAIHGR